MSEAETQGMSFAGVSEAALLAFREAARALKTAEDAIGPLRQAFAEAIKRMSEEAVKP